MPREQLAAAGRRRAGAESSTAAAASAASSQRDCDKSVSGSATRAASLEGWLVEQRAELGLGGRGEAPLVQGGAEHEVRARGDVSTIDSIVSTTSARLLLLRASIDRRERVHRAQEARDARAGCRTSSALGLGEVALRRGGGRPSAPRARNVPQPTVGRVAAGRVAHLEAALQQAAASSRSPSSRAQCACSSTRSVKPGNSLRPSSPRATRPEAAGDAQRLDQAAASARARSRSAVRSGSSLSSSHAFLELRPARRSSSPAAAYSEPRLK